MTKSKVKKKVKKAVTRASRRRRRSIEDMNGLHKPEPRTEQKTVRVPTYIVRALEADAAKVEKLTVPKAIVQILEKWYVENHPPARAAV